MSSWPTGKLLFSLFGALAQYEGTLSRERVMAHRQDPKHREAEKAKCVSSIIKIKYQLSSNGRASQSIRNAASH